MTEIHSGLSKRKQQGRCIRLSFRPSIWPKLISFWGDPNHTPVRLDYKLETISPDDKINNERRLTFFRGHQGNKLSEDHTPGDSDNFFGIYIPIGKALPWLPNVRKTTVRLVRWDSHTLELAYPCVEPVKETPPEPEPINTRWAKVFTPEPMVVPETDKVQFMMVHPIWGDKVWDVSDEVAQRVAKMLNDA